MLKLMRPHQYIKNIFIFIPLFFALKITNTGLLLDSFIAFAAFSMAASSVYILNDYFDIEDDKNHPKKRFRPLASGGVSKKGGIIMMILLFVGSMALISCFSFSAAAILLFYVMMNIAYSLYLKHIAILDVTIIAIGFVLRLFMGSVVTGIVLSHWIVTMTFLLALFMALAKRRDDVLIYENTGKKMRRVVDGYSLQFLDIAMAIMASVVIVSYVMYTSSVDVMERMNSQHLYLTALFVIMGVMRYLQIAFVFLDSGSPTQIVLKDRFIQMTLVSWLVSFVWILY
ncbi:MAG TPA: decaprenyl-phosphate phosphoribosyltransferase [Sulfurovum sp.]|nr:decaprenyl-phosphate phosphoribosyltransferase [Sulfurovum sp.]